MSGIFAGFFQSFIIYPLDNIRTNVIVNQKKNIKLNNIYNGLSF